MSGNEQKYIKEAFDTNWVAPLGPNVTGLNRILKIYRRKFFALSSGTAAIHLGLILLGVKAGDEVLCQSMTLLLQLILFYI
jgi:dTDP-4-amino-4,6-dideoxygalactose transaminase